MLININKEEILNKIEADENDIVFLAGSLVEGECSSANVGMGNLYSDVDVFILKNYEQYITKEAEYDFAGKKIFFFKDNNYGYDVEVYPIQDIESVVASIREASIEVGERVSNSIQLTNGWGLDDVNDFLSRYFYSIPIKNEEKYAGLVYKDDLEKFRKIYKYYLINKIDGMIEDICGNILAGQMETALLLARGCSLELMKTIIYDNGEMCSRDKWVWLKFKNIVKNKDKYNKIFKCLYTLMFEKIEESEAKTFIERYLRLQESTIENNYIGVDF